MRDYGEAAACVGIQAQRTTYQGHDASGRFRGTLVTVRRDGRWVIAGLHLSPHQSCRNAAGQRVRKEPVRDIDHGPGDSVLDQVAGNKAVQQRHDACDHVVIDKRHHGGDDVVHPGAERKHDEHHDQRVGHGRKNLFGDRVLIAAAE